MSLRDGKDIRAANQHIAELLIDCEEDTAAKAVVWGLLREIDRK